jgi:hypothetical protein
MGSGNAVEEVCALLRAHAFTVADEDELQAAVAALLAPLGARREVRVGPADRIDFVLPGGLGVEVKINGSLSALTRQVHRYAQRPAIAALIVVTTRHRLARLPDTMHGKPVRVVTVGGW